MAAVTGQISLNKKLAYSVNQFGINVLWQAFNTVAVFFYVTDLKVSGTAISAGMIVYGIVNAFFNIIVGHVSDRTHTRWGRRIPYVLFLSLPLSIVFFLLFSPPHAGPSLLVIYFLAFVLLFDLFFTFVALNIGALYPEMYRSVKDRSYVSAWQQVFGIIGMIIGVALAKSLGQTLGYPQMAMVFAFIAAVSLYVSLYGSFENPAYQEKPLLWRQAVKETLSNRLFVRYVMANFLIQLATTMFTTLSSFYTKYVVSMTSLQSMIFLGVIFIVAIPISFLWARLAIRLSTATAAMVSALLYILVTILFLFVSSPLQVIITGALLGIPVAGFMVLMNILIADVIDADEKQTSRRREGMYLGMNGFIIRIGMSVQYAIMAVFFAISGFDAQKSSQLVGTIHGFRILMGGFPIVIVGLALLALQKYRKHLTPVLSLDVRDEVAKMP